MKEDAIDDIFENIKDRLDIYEPDLGHEKRFLDKLQSQNKVVSLPQQKRSISSFWKIAASITLIFGLGYFALFTSAQEEVDLGNISPQMQETQNFFATAIQMQLEDIQKVTDKDHKKLIDDTLNQLQILETDYDKLKTDLVNSGNDKRVISAMINNFKKRTDLLEAVLEKINSINELKLSKNENNLL